MIFQLIWWYGGGMLIGAMWAIVGASRHSHRNSANSICASVYFHFGALPIGAVIYGVIGAIQVNQGQDFRYWLVGDWVRSTLTGQ